MAPSQEIEPSTNDAVDAFDTRMASAWHRYGPPARPSPAELEIYSAELRKCHSPLLLGATPDIRLIAQNLELDLTAADKNAGVFEELGRLVGNDERSTTFVEADWLTMDLGERFDLVIGDGALNMLPSGRLAQFFAQLAHHVVRGGLAMLRSYLVAPPTFATPRAVFEHARTIDGPLYTAVKIHLSQLWLDRELLALSNAVIWERLQLLAADDVLSQSELTELGAILKNDDLTVHFVELASATQLADPWFELVDTRSGADYEASEHKPILVFRRR